MSDELRQAAEDAKHRPTLDEEDKRQLLLSFVKLLSKPRYTWEMKKTYVQRASFNPIFLGVVRLRDDADIRVLNLLKEPTELVLSIPVEDVMAIDVEQNEVGLEYYHICLGRKICV